jgi:hypothetical protein
MKKLVFLTSFMVLFLVLAMPAILSLGIRFIPNNTQPPLEKVQGVFWQSDIEQGFVSQKPNLIGIALSIRNLNLKNDKDIALKLYADNALIRTTTLNGRNIEDGALVKFLFAEIADSQNKNYRFVLTSPETMGEFPLQVFYTEQKPAWALDMQFASKKAEGSLSFVTLHQPESRISLIKEIYKGWLERLYADKPFFFFYVGIVLALVVVAAII